MKNLISIIIPTYNRAQLVSKTIESIQKQTYQNWECVIIDDASTDDTEEVMKKYIEVEKRLRYYKKPNNLPKGPSATRNYGLSKCKGGYINWFDSDDLMHPKKLEIDLKHILSGEYDFTISQSEFFSESGKPPKKYWNKHLWSDDSINDFILKKIGWGINAALWKKTSLTANTLKFDENLITADDFLYHIKAMEQGLNPIVINETLSYLRVHPTRLNDYSIKSPFKLSVNKYLIGRKERLKLNPKTIERLNKQFINQFANLLKNKKINLAKKYLKKDILELYNPETKTKVKRMFALGVLYRYTGYGFRFIK